MKWLTAISRNATFNYVRRHHHYCGECGRVFWRIPNSLPKRPVLIFTKKHPNLGAPWSDFAIYICLPHLGIQGIRLKTPTLFYTRLALFRGAGRRSVVAILRVKLTLILTLVVGHFERFSRRSLVTLSIYTSTNHAARVKSKD